MTTKLQVQPCCGKTHTLPFQHTRFYQDKRGRTRHVYECARCAKTRHIDGHDIRWSQPGSPYCEVCEKALDQRITERLAPKGWF